MINFFSSHVNYLSNVTNKISNILALSRRDKTIAAIAVACLAAFSILFIYKCFCRPFKPSDNKIEPPVNAKINPPAEIKPIELSPKEVKKGDDVPKKDSPDLIKENKIDLQPNEDSPKDGQVEYEAFAQWVIQAAKEYPQEYHQGSVEKILESFNSSNSKEDFFHQLDQLKNQGYITGPCAYHIKKKIDQMMKDGQNLPQQPPHEKIDQQPLDVLGKGLFRPSFIGRLVDEIQANQKHFSKGSKEKIIQCYDASVTKQEFFQEIDKLWYQNFISDQAADRIKNYFDQNIVIDVPVFGNDIPTPYAFPEKNNSPALDEVPAKQELDEVPKDDKVKDSLSFPPAVPFFNTFSKWLTEASKAYPNDYPKEYKHLLIQAFIKSKSKDEFFRAIDQRKNNGHISGKGAYHIKKEIHQMMKGNQNLPQLPTPEKVDQQPLDPLEDGNNIPAPLPTPFLKWNEDPLDPLKLDLKVAESFPGFPAISEQTRYGVRDKMKEDLCKVLKLKTGESFDDLVNITQKLMRRTIKLSAETKRCLQQTLLYTPLADQSKYMSRDTQLLGRFDVLGVYCSMDYDANWQPNPKDQSPFYLLHGAAINIGESAHAADFQDYSSYGKLNEQKYVHDMGKIFHQILAAQVDLGNEDAVWFPFGMGAFLRNLFKCDKTYENNQALAELRQKLAHAFVQEIANFPSLHIHMCLPLDQVKGSKDQQNYNAFINAFAHAPHEVKERISLHVNVDATDLAQRLANQHKDLNKVSLVNGANRNLIGNHWFEDRALVAIDENIHRRSLFAVVAALLLNDGIKTKVRNDEALAARVEQLLGGQCAFL